MALRLHASRQLGYRAARLLDQGKGQMEASLAKLYASRMAELVTRDAMQVHGAMGYGEETDVSRYFVDARVLAIFEGAEETLSLRVIGRTLTEARLVSGLTARLHLTGRPRLCRGRGRGRWPEPRTCPTLRVMPGDHHTPWTLAGEKGTLVDFLDYLRGAVIRKASGLPAAAARRPMVGSGTSLLGLIKHLTRVEIVWFQYAFAGADVQVPGDDLADDDDPQSVIGDYQAAVAVSNRIVAESPDLSQPAKRRAVAPEPMSLRWILVHMIEETGRHAGHADILREQIDGSVGR